MITRDGAKMSKSRGNTVSPGRVRRALRRRHRPHLHLLHGPAGARRRLDRRGGRGRQPLPLPALAALRGGRGANRAGGCDAGRGRRRGRASCCAKAHWAIDKATRDFQRGFQFNTVIAAVMELVNDAYRLKDGLYGDAGRATPRCASPTATAASLIFPFAPHLGAEIWERLNGERVWEQPWPEADPALLRSDTVDPRRPGQRQAPRPDRGGGRGPGGGAAGAGAGEREGPAPPRRQGGRQGDRRPRQAGQPRSFADRRPARPLIWYKARRCSSDDSREPRSRSGTGCAPTCSWTPANSARAICRSPGSRSRPGPSRRCAPHEEAEQVYVVVRGAGTMSVAGDTQQVAEGDLILVPPATDHSIANDGDARARLRLGPVAAGRGLRALRRPDGRGRRLRRRRRRSRAGARAQSLDWARHARAGAGKLGACPS